MVLFYANYSLLKMWHVAARQFVSQRLHLQQLGNT